MTTSALIALSEIEVALPEAALETIAQRVAEILERKHRFLSKTALAEHLGVSPRTVKTWREHGLPGRRVGREVMFDLAEVERWIDGEGR